MKKRQYGNYIYVIGYLMLMRVVLAITVGISIFSTGVIFDLFLIMFWTGAFAIFMSNQTVQKVYYIIIIFVVTVFVIGDSIYYDYFETISSKQSFGGLKWLQEGNTLEYDISIPLVVYLVVPLLLVVIYLIITNKKKDFFYLKDFAILSSVFVVQVALFLVWGGYQYETRIEYYRSDGYLFEAMYDRELFSEKYGYYNYHLLDFTRLREKSDSEALSIEVNAYFEELNYKHTNNDMSHLYEGYNVVQIIGESLDTRFIDPVLTPNLYNMMTNGLSFDNYFTPVFQQGATCNSEFMSLTGLSAITTNDWSNNICDAYSNNTYSFSTPYQLRDIGYNTYYFHGGHEWFYNRIEAIPSYGIETVKFQEDLIKDLELDDYEDKLDSNMLMFIDEYVEYDDPFFMTLLTYSMHGGYNQEMFDVYSTRVESAYPDNEFDPEFINYLEKLAEFDTLIGDLFTRFEQEGILDNTIFVVYPDHYPYMLDEDVYLDAVGIEASSPEIMRQSLLIYATNMTGEVVHQTGSTMDIAPTILNMVHPNPEFKYFLGRDLFSSEENYVLFSNLTITDGDNFLYINKKMFGEEEQFLYLEAALEAKITAFEIQKKILEADYFRDLEK